MTKEIMVPDGYMPRPYQGKLLGQFGPKADGTNGQYMRAVLMWARGLGKDMTCWSYMVREAARKVGVYYYFFPTYAQGKKALWENMDFRNGKRYLDFLPKELVSATNGQEMRIDLINGSIIRIIGTDNFDSIRGSRPTGLIFSEYAWQDPRAWEEYGRGAIAVNPNAWVIFNSTPDGPNHFKKIYDMAVNNPEWLVCTETVETAFDIYGERVVSDKVVDSDRKSGMDEDTIQKEYYCSFSTAAKGAFYGDCIQKAREEGRVGIYPPSDHLWTDTFWDIGRSDDTAIWFRQLNGQGQFWVDYYQDNNKSLAHYIEVMEAKKLNYRTHFLPHDAGNKTAHSNFPIDQQLASLACEAKIGSDFQVCEKVSKMNSIYGVRGLFSRFYFHEATTREGLEKLELYHRRFDPRNKVFMAEPAHDSSSHCADAIALVPNAKEIELKTVNNYREEVKIIAFNDYEENT